jgi:hypothetical protein
MIVFKNRFKLISGRIDLIIFHQMPIFEIL